MRQIHSLYELPQDERRRVRTPAIRIGLLTCFLGIAILYFNGLYPFTEGTGFFFFVSFVLSFNPPIL